MANCVTITGVLKTPMNTPASCVPIEVESTGGTCDVLTSAVSTYYTDADGCYCFDLNYGCNQIRAQFDDAMECIGDSVTNCSVPNPSTINELLCYTTPVQPPVVDNIYECIDDVYNDLINDINTDCISLQTQIADGDAAVVNCMTIYTNECTGECMAVMTDYVNAGDASVLSQANAYTDTCGTEIASCTTQLSTELAAINSNYITCSTYNTGQASMIDCLEAGDASVYSNSTAYTNQCTGEVCAFMLNCISTGNAEVIVCIDTLEYVSPDDLNTAVATLEQQISAGDATTQTNAYACSATVQGNVDDLCDTVVYQESGYEIVTSAGAASASISLVASSTADASNSSIYMKADCLVFTNDSQTPFTEQPLVVSGGQVYINEANICCVTAADISAVYMCGSCICSGCMIGSLLRSPTYTSTTGYCINASGQATFNQITARGNISATSLCADSADIVGTTHICGFAVTIPQMYTWNMGPCNPSSQPYADVYAQQWCTLGKFNMPDTCGGGYLLTVFMQYDSNDRGICVRLMVDGQEMFRRQNRFSQVSDQVANIALGYTASEIESGAVVCIQAMGDTDKGAQVDYLDVTYLGARR